MLDNLNKHLEICNYTDIVRVNEIDIFISPQISPQSNLLFLHLLIICLTYILWKWMKYFLLETNISANGLFYVFMHHKKSLTW